MDEKKYLIIYHSEDNDGLFSCAIFRYYLIKTLNVPEKNISMLGATYNSLSEFQKQNTPKQLHQQIDVLIMTDISFNDASFMKKLYDEFGTDMVWCDHHAPVIQESFKQHFEDVPGVRESDRSAILCVWKYLYDQSDEIYKSKHVTGGELPELFRILSAWDSWSWDTNGYNFDYVKEINKGANFEYQLDSKIINELVYKIMLNRNQPVNIDNPTTFEGKIIDKLHEVGKILAEYDARNARSIVASDGDMEWTVGEDNHKACALFIQGATNSTMFESVASKVRHGIVFKHRRDNSWTISMYNTSNDDDFHCGEYLKRMYSGGGHTGAAGCTFTEEQFIDIIKKKHI